MVKDKHINFGNSEVFINDRLTQNNKKTIMAD